MNHRFRPKFSVVSAATSALAAPHDQSVEARRQAEHQAMLDEVARRLPRKQAIRDLQAKTQQELNAALKDAIERYLGEPLEDPAVLEGRFEVVRLPDDEGDTYLMDGTPILWAGPILLSEEGDNMHANRSIRLLKAKEGESQP